jgi:hypothetical protein
MNFALALAIAVNFWTVRGVEVPCHPVPVSGAQLQLDPQFTGWNAGLQIPMAADVGACRILISRWGALVRRDNPEVYCASVTHEVGHIAGLSHTPTGIMAESGQGPGDTPHYCDYYKVFARRQAPSHRPIRP